MVKPRRRLRSHCPINFGLEIFGDRWTLLVLRDMLIVGKHGYREFQASEEAIASNILSDRLTRLEESGLIERHVMEGDARQIRYVPTEACRKLLPVLVEIAYWGAIHDPKTAAPKDFVTAYERDRDGLLKAMAAGFNPSKPPR